MKKLLSLTKEMKPMTKNDFYELANICAENKKLAKNSGDKNSQDMSAAMADCIAFSIFELARKELCGFTDVQWDEFRIHFFNLAKIPE